MAGSTGIKGSQVKDETLTGDDIKDGTVNRSDMNTTTVGQSVVTQIAAGTNITITETGSDSGTGLVTISSTGVAGGDACVGGAGATYVFLASECVGGEAA